MLDIGGWEFMLVAFVLIIVVGPKELPKMLRGFTKLMQQVRTLAREFNNGVNDLAREADMTDLKKSLDEAKSGNLDNIANAIDPSGDLKTSIGSSLDEVTDTIKKSTSDLGSIKDDALATGDALAAKTNKTSANKKAAAKKVAPNKAATKKAAANRKAATKKAPPKAASPSKKKGAK